MAVPKPPLWGKNNNPEEWWSTNDFKIFSAAYRHEVEGFLKIVSPYIPSGSIPEDNIPEPRTPTGATVQPSSATELPAPKRSRVQKFGDVENVENPPISVYTSQGRLTALLNDEEINDSLSNNNKGRKEDNEEKGRIVPEGKKSRRFERVNLAKDYRGAT
jgi:hypothetical protein